MTETAVSPTPATNRPRSSASEPGEALVGAVGLSMSVVGPSGPRHILENLSLDLRPGQMIAVTGRTGSGKSTLLRILAGFLLPQQGSVAWEGTALEGLNPEQVTRLRHGFLGYLDQESPVIDGLSALEAITVGAGPLRRSERAEARRRANRLARSLGLELVLDRDVRTLSGGERQRVGLAGLIIAKPRALLLDEPSSALDEATTHRIIAQLRELVDSGVGILTATHDPLLIEAADTVIPLH